MFKVTNVILSFGVLLLALVIINTFTIDEITPTIQRSQSISAIASVAIIAISILLNDISPNKPKKVTLSGSEGFKLEPNLNKKVEFELAWGTKLLLTATAASTILIYWEGKTILRRGIIIDSCFQPGEICRKAQEQNRLVSLVNTSLFPGRNEFDSVLKDLPSVMIYPLSNKGVLILGGWSIRCFTKSDEKWIVGWANKIADMLAGNYL